MGYIEKLRKFIGHDPILLVGAAVFIFDEKERLLLLRRTDNGCWGPPGGGMEPGEHFMDSIKRETREETGLEIEEMTFLDIFSGPEYYYRYPNGDEVYNIIAMYKSRHVTGKLLLNPDEHTEAQYFDLDDIPQDLSPPLLPIFKKLIHDGDF